MKTWKLLISDLFVNLSAGWFGAAVVVSTFSNDSLIPNFQILLLDVGFGILFLLLAFRLRLGS